MGFYTLGISAGIMLAYLAGGWVAENIGWREAFLIVGVPGLLLALIVRFTVAEPQRGASEQRLDSGRQPRILTVMRFLLARRSFPYMAVAAGLSAFVGYSVVNFFPSFMVRSFAVDVATLGFVAGTDLRHSGRFRLFYGWLPCGSRRPNGARKALSFIALAMLVTVIVNFAVYLAPTVFWCLLCPSSRL